MPKTRQLQAPRRYQPRVVATSLHRVVTQEIDSFCAQAATRGHHLPRFVRQTFDAFLACGDPSRGFVHLQGGLVSVADLGDPSSTTAFALCLYDYTADTPSLAASINIPPSGNWSPAGAYGFAYKDNTLSADGGQKAKIKAGLTGKSKAQLKAKGVNLPLPLPATTEQFFNADQRVTIQLVNSNGKCWSSEFGANEIQRNEASHFQAKVR